MDAVLFKMCVCFFSPFPPDLPRVFSDAQASVPTLAGLRVGRPKTCGRSGGSRSSMWDTKPTAESLPTPLLLLPLPPRQTSPNCWKISSANHHPATPLTALRWVEHAEAVFYVTARCMCRFFTVFFLVGVRLVWNYSFFQPFFLSSSDFTAGLCVQRAWREPSGRKKNKKSLFPVRIPQNDRAHHTYWVTLPRWWHRKPTLTTQPAWDDTELNLWIRVRAI